MKGFFYWQQNKVGATIITTVLLHLLPPKKLLVHKSFKVPYTQSHPILLLFIRSLLLVLSSLVLNLVTANLMATFTMMISLLVQKKTHSYQSSLKEMG
uniref:Transmembrane protein n=1 Tax=Medicago truncatula TaxID=3880 RepID=I3S0A8_MEDTR|nr:unknown [Medicago truncatula]